MPLTENGFQRMTYDDVLNTQIERAKLLFGEDIDTSEQSTFGKILRLYCLDSAENQELAEKVYLSAFPNTASGVNLDRLCPLVGISRNPATYAQHSVTISGTAGTPVPMGFLVSAGDVIFHTVDSYSIGSGGTIAATVECNDAGEVGNVALGDIDTIVNPESGITGVSHTAVETIAKNKETDYELRTRFSQALSGTGSGTLDAIKGAILRVPTVESVYIEENSTDATVGDLPAHSFRCFVSAPASAKEQIAKAIFSKKPIGIATKGDVWNSVYDAGGGIHTIYFSWTTTVNIHVKCSISTDSSYSAESLQAIKDNIVEKINRYTNGQDVTATSLYSAIYVDGVTDVTSLQISSNGTTYGTAAIEISNSQIARTAASYIEVTVNE